MNQELLQYISQQVEDGFSREQIRRAILAAGWAEADVEEAFDEFERSLTAANPDGTEQKLVQHAAQSAPAGAGNAPVAQQPRPSSPARPAAASPNVAALDQSRREMSGRVAQKPAGRWVKIALTVLMVIVIAAVAVGAGVLGAQFYLSHFAK